MKKYHFIYQVTNLVNGKFYIGVHSTNEVEDGYMGSGSLLKSEIKAFGLQKFDREILYYFNDRKDALDKEAEIVNIEFLSNPLTYNLVCGGNNGIRTVKEKAIYFNRSKVNLLKYRNTPFEPADPEFKTIFKLNTPIKFKRWNNKKHPLTAVRNDISEVLEKMQGQMMKWITDAYNNKFTHEGGKRLLDLASTKSGFAGNIIAERVKWNTVNKTDINL